MKTQAPPTSQSLKIINAIGDTLLFCITAATWIAALVVLGELAKDYLK